MVDIEKLKTVLAADHTKVRDLFAGVGATKGLRAVCPTTSAGQTGTNGMITSRINTDDTSSRASRRHREAQLSYGGRGKALKAQFAAMETALNNSQAQQAWLTGQIASLPLY